MPTLPAPNWRQLFGIDLRSLALFRVLIALTCIIEILHIWPDSFAIFDDRGIYPRSEAISWNDPHVWSLYYLSGTILWARFLMCLTLLSSFALLIGYRTRIASVLCWILMLSYTGRIIAFTSGAHMLLPAYLFWGMFLPLNAKFSVDAALNDIPAENNNYLSGATFAFLIQIGCLYLFSALLKMDSVWNSSGNAIYYVLNTTTQTSPLGSYLAQWPSLLSYLTLSVYYLELFAVFFLFCPYYNAWTRVIILPFLIALHLSFLLFLAIGTFPIICLSGLAIFIPGKVWDIILTWFNQRPKRANIIVYYDAPCDFCRKVCLIFKTLGLPPQTPVIPAQDYPKVAAILQREQSWVIQDSPGNYLTHWNAVAWCWRRSPLLWPLGILFLPRFMQKVGEKIYLCIAKHRATLANLSAQFLPTTSKKLDFQPFMVTQFALVILINVIVLSHIDTVNTTENLLNGTSSEVKSPITRLTTNGLVTLGLNQKMDFFAPKPIQSTRWVTLEGVQKDGKIIDLLRHTHKPAPIYKPVNGYVAYPNHYWFKFFDRINYNAVWERIIGNYFCLTQNTGDSALVSVRLAVFEQQTVLPGNPMPLVTRRAKFEYSC
jgi:predicted DCC family thiol-disulfide oxidoreductase YuxK